MLTKLEALILGIIQGLTEFLPISSTGHLYLGRNLFGLQEAGLLLDTMLHVGTLLAVFVFYKDEFIKIIKKPFSKLTFLLIVGTIPAVIFGLAFKDYIDEISKTGVTIGWEFLITGLFLWLADSAKNGHKRMDDISYKDAFIIGTFQAVAIMPAISRSGMTIVAALWRKLDRKRQPIFPSCCQHLRLPERLFCKQRICLAAVRRKFHCLPYSLELSLLRSSAILQLDG